MMIQTNRVLITAGENKSALAAVRSLARRGLEIHVSASSRLAIARWSRYAKNSHTLTSPQRDAVAFCTDLIHLQTLYRFVAILLVCDYEIGAWLEYGEMLDSHALVDSVIAIPSRSSFRLARDKSLTIQCALAAGVPCPATWFPDLQPLDTIRAEATYPLLVKPNVSEGARGITLVERPDDLESVLSSVQHRWGPCHLQEYIPSGGAQFKADVIVDRQGEQHSPFVCRKVRYYPVSGGSSTLIVSEHHEEIENAMQKLIKKLRWYGFADFDFIVDPRDGCAKLIECNPRFPESLSVTIFAGADFPWMMFCLICSGIVPPTPDWIDGRYSRFLAGDLMWFLGSPDRLRAKPSFLRFIAKNQTYYVEHIADIGPTICYLLIALLTFASSKQKAYRFGRGFRQQKISSSSPW